jgi:hypothetical protein
LFYLKPFCLPRGYFSLMCGYFRFVEWETPPLYLHVRGVSMEDFGYRKKIELLVDVEVRTLYLYEITHRTCFSFF